MTELKAQDLQSFADEKPEQFLEFAKYVKKLAYYVRKGKQTDAKTFEF